MRDRYSLQIRSFEPLPEVVGDAKRISAHAEACEVAPDVLDVASQQLARVGVKPRIDRLRKVDDHDAALPVENVVGREVSVDAVKREPELDVAHDLAEEAHGFV